jgi:hypothetical protein
MGGYCCRLDRDVSDRITEAAIRAGAYQAWTPRRELRRIARRHRKAVFYNLLRHSGKPKLAGGNIGIWRSDFERVNGYDENFIGWGGEDDDLRRRLAAAGLRIGSILRWTHTYHLWHVPTPTASASYWQGVNVQYLHRPGRLARCRHGLVERPLDDISMRIVGAPADPRAAREFLERHVPHCCLREPPEVEFLFFPGTGRFTGRAQCNVLVVFDGRQTRSWRERLRLARGATYEPHLVLADDPAGLKAPHASVFPTDSAIRLFDAIV